MKTKMIFFALLVTFNVSGWASLQGPSTGGGGFAVVCPATPVSSAKIELLDLYEGRKLGLHMAKATGDLREDYFQSVKRTYTIQGMPNFTDQSRDTIMEYLVKFMQSTKFIERVEDLPKADDLGKVPWIPSQCSIQQIAYFDDAAEVVYVLRSYWEQLDTMNQSALIQHELWGNGVRSMGLPPAMARLSVAHIFATSGRRPLLDGVLDSSEKFRAHTVFFDGNRSSSFRSIQKMGYGAVSLRRLQFTQLAGVPLLSKTWIDLPYVNWNLKFARSATNPNIVGCIVQNPNVNIRLRVPVQGTIEGLIMVYEMKTGEPIRLTLLKDEMVLQESLVDTVSKCDGNY